MLMKLRYSQSQFDSAVEFIASNNQTFLGKHDLIKEELLSSINDLANDSESLFFSTMGFMIMADRNYEDMDFDENVCKIDIFIDPSIGNLSSLDDDDIVSSVINVNYEGVNASAH